MPPDTGYSVIPLSLRGLLALAAILGAASLLVAQESLATTGGIGGRAETLPARTRGKEVGAVLRSLQRPIERAFDTRVPIPDLRIYPTHRAFAQALNRLEDEWPEGTGDNAGNVIHGILPLGPSVGWLRHTLAHVYTEWVLDRLTKNRSDRQPDPAWLYDGIGEYEADRMSGPLTCRLRDTRPLPLSRLSSPQEWWRLRATPLAGAEYCEAEQAAARIVRRVGWSRMVEVMTQSRSWTAFFRAIERRLFAEGQG